MVIETKRAAAALFHLDPGHPRDECVRAGMAAKAAGLSFDEFNDWSGSAGNYAVEQDCSTFWKSFSNSRTVAVNSLFAMAYAQGWQDPAMRLQTAKVAGLVFLLPRQGRRL